MEQGERDTIAVIDGSCAFRDWSRIRCMAVGYGRRSGFACESRSVRAVIVLLVSLEHLKHGGLVSSRGFALMSGPRTGVCLRWLLRCQGHRSFVKAECGAACESRQTGRGKR